MPKATEALSVAGCNLVTASQRLLVENYSSEARRHLVRTAKDVLEGTLKVTHQMSPDYVRASWHENYDNGYYTLQS